LQAFTVRGSLRGMPILDHISVFVTDLAASRRFYEQALEPLGIKTLMAFDGACGLGREKPELWLGVGPASFQQAAQLAPITPIHVAIAARNRAEVDAFYKAAMAAGGKDFGPPGVRAIYHPNYYGAFVLDPDGHNLEAVFHG
jgi:catechol 2,3-dioxygenase-like lactoylglutathione lyase family enzyme